MNHKQKTYYSYHLKGLTKKGLISLSIFSCAGMSELRGRMELLLRLSVRGEVSNYISGDAIVWKASRHTTMPEGGGSHIEAHGYSLIITASHEESCKLTSLHQHSVIVCCVQKIIAVLIFFVQHGHFFSQKFPSTPVELSTSFHLRKEINIYVCVGGRRIFWWNLPWDLNELTEWPSLEKNSKAGW